jgi:epoxyqueuosine reductase
MLPKSEYTSFVKSTAHSLGFDYCGIAKAVKLDEEAKRLELWLDKGFHGKMAYMENYFDLRTDPSKLVPGAKSVITLLLNYFPSQHQNPEAPQISKYAYGNDYHEVIKKKLKFFLQTLKENIGEINGRGFTDSAPVL